MGSAVLGKIWNTKRYILEKSQIFFFLTDKHFKTLSGNPRVSIRPIDLKNDSHLDWK